MVMQWLNNEIIINIFYLDYNKIFNMLLLQFGSQDEAVQTFTQTE